MAAEGVAAGERMYVEVRRERFAHGDAAERNVRRRHAFGEREHIGHDAEAFGRKRGAGAPEARHHLVEDQQNAVAIAHRAQALQIAFGVDDDAVRADDRFDEQRRDAIAALVADDLVEVRERAGRILRPRRA